MLSNQPTQVSVFQRVNRSFSWNSVSCLISMAILGAALLQCIPLANAQSAFFNQWERRVNKTVSDQPAWPLLNGKRGEFPS
jgi:hypothetical protein